MGILTLGMVCLGVEVDFELLSEAGNRGGHIESHRGDHSTQSEH